MTNDVVNQPTEDVQQQADPTVMVPRLLSPAKGKPVVRRDAERLHRYAILNGGVINLTDETYAELEQAPWNIKRNRVAACVCNLRQYYGKVINNKRDGRKVIAYVFED